MALHTRKSWYENSRAVGLLLALMLVLVVLVWLVGVGAAFIQTTG